MSEQSENTLDSDSKLSLSFQSKLLQSPPNHSSNSSLRQVEKFNSTNNNDSQAEEESGLKSESNSASFPVPAESKDQPKSKSKNRNEVNAEQDMFSEHFDVSLFLY